MANFLRYWIPLCTVICLPGQHTTSSLKGYFFLPPDRNCCLVSGYCPCYLSIQLARWQCACSGSDWNLFTQLAAHPGWLLAYLRVLLFLLFSWWPWFKSNLPRLHLLSPSLWEMLSLINELTFAPVYFLFTGAVDNGRGWFSCSAAGLGEAIV